MKKINELLQWGFIAAILFVLLFQFDFDLLETTPKRVTEIEQHQSQQQKQISSLGEQHAKLQAQVVSIEQKVSKLEKQLKVVLNSDQLEQVQKDVQSLKSEVNSLNRIAPIMTEESQNESQLSKTPITPQSSQVETWFSSNFYIISAVSILFMLSALGYLVYRRKFKKRAVVRKLNPVSHSTRQERECA
ncbi:hypothetical protein [uncultured Thalassolituus sp.]|uniref:hypothetical protein n=1 Tax=uncultured Thalassolituus sp. TaxID=285273 RepID=UPI0026312C56|nr:hypothetical protein [uncultured Thalassolituus sp.]